MPLRHVHALNLPDSELRVPSVPEDLVVRSPRVGDREALASLMLDAYAGTIDDENGLMEEARTEVENYLKGEYGDPLLAFSRICLDSSGNIISAVLNTRWGRAELPLVAFVMTAPEQKGYGIASMLMRESLTAMKEAGENEVHAVITDGNVPSEKLFTALGFRVIETLDD